MLSKKNRLFSVIAVVLTVTLVLLVSTSCIRFVGFTGSGNVITEERTIADFDSISVSAGINLFIEQGDDEALTIEAEDNIVPRISTDVRNGRLEIRFKAATLGGLNLRKPVNVYVTAVDIDEIEVSSGADVETDELKTDKLSLDLSSGSGADVIVDVNDLDISLSSGSNLKIKGKATNQEVDLSSGVSYDAEDLESKITWLDVSSGSDATVWVTEKLDVSISSGGSVWYKGSPEIVSDISSGGSMQSF
jgi:hypothetical protein